MTSQDTNEPALHSCANPPPHDQTAVDEGLKRPSGFSISALVNEVEAAEFLRLKVATLRRWRWAGKGPSFVKVGAAVRYDPQDLSSFIEAGRRTSTSDTGAEAA